MSIRRFAFIVHPLSINEIHQHPAYRWTHYLPDELVERSAAYMPPLFISKVKGIVSPTTNQEVEGFLYALSATPRQLLRQRPEFTYRRVLRAAKLAAKQGAKLMGLGAFTSVVGDAGVTIAAGSPIAVTSGNSLTAIAAIEAAKAGLAKMGRKELKQCCAMVIGATGSIGSTVSRLLAREVDSLVLISRTQEKVTQFTANIAQEFPNITLRGGTQSGQYVENCDVIITATSAFAERILDISNCKPGAVICDVARPQDLSPEEAILRPDVLVIDSGEIKLPGNVDLGYNIGLERGVVFACMAESILLTLEGRFQHYTLGRTAEIEKSIEMLQLFHKHQFSLAPLRSFNQTIAEVEFARKRELTQRMLIDEAYSKQIVNDAITKLAAIAPTAKGITSRHSPAI